MTFGDADALENQLRDAREAHERGELADAADAYRSALASRPEHVAARVALGRVLLAGGDATAARTELFTALQHDPDQMVARRLLVDANLALGDDLEAHRWLVEYLKVVADDEEARALLGQIEPRLRSAAPRATRTLGKLYLEQGHAEEAARVFAGLAEAGHADTELRSLAERADGAAGERRRRARLLLARLREWRRRLDMIGVHVRSDA